MRSIGSLGLCTAVSVAALTFAPAALAQQTLAAVQARGQINVGYRVDASPFSLRDAQGAAVGYMVDHCQRVATQLQARAGRELRVNFVPVAVDQFERVVRSGSIDLLCSATTDTEARRAVMAFSHPLYIAAVKLLVRRADHIAQAKELEGLPVVAIGRTTADGVVRGRAGEFKWQPVRALNADAALGQLQVGMAKAFARDDVLLTAQLAASGQADAYVMLPEPYSREPIAIAMRRDDPGLLDLVNQAITDSVRDGSAQAIYDKWFLNPVPPHGKALGVAMSEPLKAVFQSLR